MLNNCCVCKSISKIEPYEGRKEVMFFGLCTSNKCSLMGPYGKTEEEAEAKWNSLQCKQSDPREDKVFIHPKCEDLMNELSEIPCDPRLARERRKRRFDSYVRAALSSYYIRDPYTAVDSVQEYAVRVGTETMKLADKRFEEMEKE